MLTLPWERIDDSSPIAAKMAAWAAREIIEQRFAPGILLTEAELAAAQGASRTPAREAMLQLERWRLVRLVPKKGAIVTTVTGSERRDLLAVRVLFEVDAAHALKSASGLEPVAADLRTLLDRQRQALNAGDTLGFASADYSFHARIIRSGGNAVVDEMLTTMGPRLARLTYQAVIDRPGSLDTLFDEHAELTDLAERSDADAFGALIRRHIDATHFA
ncbi:GntR family transcriptional regulator [Brevibacterium renqingii]|uniref:GntR family transcriptional regulator n=1 Tax=Brevibacterium renqingii TaxID=2776916 RepID=UPI0020A409D8|nr:GntR family transcriptional regulator [Brevibacterium renqingii]